MDTVFEITKLLFYAAVIQVGLLSAYTGEWLQQVPLWLADIA